MVHSFPTRRSSDLDPAPCHRIGHSLGNVIVGFDVRLALVGVESLDIDGTFGVCHTSVHSGQVNQRYGGENGGY